MKDESLDPAEIVSHIESSVEELQSSVKQKDYTEEQLGQILEAEKAHKNRKTAVTYLQAVLGAEESHSETDRKDIGVLEYIEDQEKLVLDINGVKFELPETPYLKLGGMRFQPSPGEEDIVEDISRVEGYGEKSRHGMVESLEDFGIPDSKLADMGTEQLRKLYHDLSRFKQIKKELEDLEEEEEDSSAKDARGDPGSGSGMAERSGGGDGKSYSTGTDTPDQTSDESQENSDTLLENEEGKKQVTEEKEPLEGPERKEKEEKLREQGYSEEKLKEKSSEELEQLEEKLEDVEKLGEELEEDIDEEIEDSTLEELEELANKLEERAELEQELEQAGYEGGDLREMSLEELEEEKDKLDEKREVASEMGLEMDDAELAEVKLEELEQIRQEKEEREKLIEELKKEGLFEDELKKSSTEDLRKLASELGLDYSNVLKGQVEEVLEQIKDLDEPDYAELLEKEKEGQNRQEVKEFLKEKIQREKEDYVEEAEDDLEMLQGAKKKEESEEDKEENSYFQGLESFQEKIKRLWESDDEGRKEQKLKQEKVLGLLEEYRGFEYREKAVKTAHVMKGFLEEKLEIEREMTYGELASELEGETTDELVLLGDFFSDMEREEYMGNITADMDEVMDAAEETVRQLSL